MGYLNLVNFDTVVLGGGYVELADLLVPTLYFLPDRVAFAFDFALELAYRF